MIQFIYQETKSSMTVASYHSMNLMSYGSETKIANITMYEQLRQEILMYLGGDENMTAEILALPPDEMAQTLEAIRHYSAVNTGLDHVSFIEFRIHKALSLYIPPFLLLMGTFGNLFSFLILRNKTMTRQSTNLFLAALAVADSIVLVVGLLRRWLAELTTVDIMNESPWLCKSVSLFLYSSSQFSVWLIIAVTIERYIVVSHPLQTSRFCNIRRAKRVISLLALTFICINIHLFWTVTVNEKVDNDHVSKKCGPEAGFQLLIEVIWQWIDSVLYALGPFLIIAIFNALIITQTIRATTWRGSIQNGPLIKMETRKATKDNNVKLTVMLLSVSFTFLVTTFPMAIVMIYHPQWNREIDAASVRLATQRQLIRTVAEMLMYLNHSVNFYLYCALGQKFRNQVIRTLCGRTLSNTSNVSDHSQHLYCSRGCKANGYHIHKSMEETAL